MKKLRNAGKRIAKDMKAYGMAAVIFLVYYLLVHLFRSAFCPMITLTGFPCAGCGLTRSFFYLLQGQPVRAAYMNPMSFCIVAFALYCGYYRYIKGTEIKGFTVLFTLLVAGMLLFYFVRMYLYFPDRVPYTYAENNLLAQKIPGYQKLAERLIEILRASRSS